jgi:hypothetical protein
MILTATADTICNGDLTDVTLTAQNGVLGTDAVYEWSTDGFASTIPGEDGASIVVSPTSTTTYSVRINGPAPCSYPSASQSFTLYVTDPSTAPDDLTATADTICNGDATNVTLTAQNGVLGTDAAYEWSTDGFATTIPGEDGASIIVSPGSTTTYSVRIVGTLAPCADVSGTVQEFTLTVTEGSTAPDAVTATADTICNGDLTNVTLTAQNGVLGTDAVYEWSDDNFASTLPGEDGVSIVVSPTATTTYSVRINGPAPCDYPTADASFTLTVTDPSTAPDDLTATADTICNGDVTNVTLTAQNGVLGTDAVYEWSTDNFATIIPAEIGASIVVSPTSTTTYSVRINGPAPCSYPTASESFTLTVTEGSTAPDAVTATADTICNGDLTNVTLTAQNGVLGTDAVYEWSDDNFASTLPGEDGVSIIVSPTSTTTYSVRITGPAPCDYPTADASFTLTVTEPSTAPDDLTATADTICNGDLTNVTLTAQNGVLGTDAVYEWSTDNFGTVDTTTTDAFIIRSPLATTTYYVRISGPAPCADVSSTVQSVIVTVTEGSTAPDAVTATADTICNGDLTNVTLTAQNGVLGTDAVYEWSTDGFTSTPFLVKTE